MNRSTAWLVALHMIGNALLLWLGYYWLGVGESDAAHLAWSATLVAVLAAAALWLHGTAFVFFGEQTGSGFATAARAALRHLPPLFVVAIAAGIVYGLLAWWHDSFGHKAFVIGSYATMKLRKPVAPSGVLRAFYVSIWLLRWMLVPAILFRLAGSVALRGWAGFRSPWPVPRGRRLYWFAVCALLLCAVWVPLRLINWVPHVKQFALQLASFASRLGFAYLLFASALLLIEFLTSAGRPRLTQPSTAPSP
jgi:hypothetical protein